MASAPRILQRLPSLYRPEPGYDDGDLLLALATAISEVLDELSQESAELMQAHWYGYADSALFSRWVGRRRALDGSGPLTRADPAIDQFPYLCDLPRIAALVDLVPWREPLRDRERVEAFRERVGRIVRLHRDGLGTVRALRTMTMAALPQVDPDAPEGLRERSFTVEELCGALHLDQAVSQPGLPADMVGPLMRWRIDSNSQGPVAPLVVIEGVTPVAGDIDPTSEPVIERFDPATGTGVGIHYQGDLAPGQALALVPGYHSWLGLDAGLGTAARIPAGIETVDPTAAGPWGADAGAPTGTVAALVQTEDHHLWAAVNGADGSLWRRGAAGWQQVLGALPRIHCLLASGGELLIGLATGLTRLPIQPDGPFAASPNPTTLGDPAVHALAHDAAGTLWAATARGLAREAGGTLVYTGLGERAETETALSALAIVPSGDIYCGGELGLFLYRRKAQRWYVLQGEAADETVPDWLGLDLVAGTLPAAETLFVPPVHAIARGPAAGIWLGTAQGIARYRAREERRTYTTLLEAFPQLTQASVHQIALDARQRLWFATGEGLFVHDGLDWFQRRGSELARLPRMLEEPEQPVFWRYQRTGGSWQSLAPPTTAGFQGFAGTQVGTAEPAVHAPAWTESAQARLGSFDGSSFTVDAGATPSALATRYKPSVTRIVEGGVAAVPRLPAGTSDWRYLQREESSPPTPSANPAWSREGRLLPPPTQSAAPYEGRYLAELLAPSTAVFAFNPAARVWLQWRPRAPLAVTVRLARAAPGEQIDPLILDRVYNELQRVRPAGVRVYLAVDEMIERGL